MAWTFYSIDPPDTYPHWACADCGVHEVAGVLADPDLGPVHSEARGVHLETVAGIYRSVITPVGNVLAVGGRTVPALFCTGCYARRKQYALAAGWKPYAEENPHAD